MLHIHFVSNLLKRTLHKKLRYDKYVEIYELEDGEKIRIDWPQYKFNPVELKPDSPILVILPGFNQISTTG